jgi:hypothetical protein
LIADLGHEGDLLHRIGLPGTRPHIGDFLDLAFFSGREDVFAERLAGLVL